MKGPASLERTLGYTFKDRTLLEAALTHRSHRHESEDARTGFDYERLEFLGDALLGFIVSERLMELDPEADEGTLTRRKQTLVSRDTLAGLSQALGIGEVMRLGRGEEATGGRLKPSLLGDVFESVLAAVYLDGGIRAARAFVRRHLASDLARTARAAGPLGDDKTQLQEEAQARWRLTPRYRTVETTGPAHDRRFAAEVLIGERVWGRGTGTRRKEAERQAARAALAALGKDQ